MLIVVIILLVANIVINGLIYHSLNNLPKPKQKRLSKKNIDILPMDIQ